jgi:nicotinate-nucleotide pyrophosphorylase (carboxylating)
MIDFRADMEDIVRRALAEDIGTGDVTTLATVPEGLMLNGRIVARAPGVLAGVEASTLVFKVLNEDITVDWQVKDGADLQPLQTIANLSGPGRALLTGERTALNILQRMSGIATLTRRYVEGVKGTRAVILDTRKTAPGLRMLDKLAVKLGGGENHRFGLFDMALIKNNHIAAVGGDLAEAVRRVRLSASHVPVEIEVRTLEQLEIALQLDIDRILLDNMSLEMTQQAVKMSAGRMPLEASGGINLQNVAQVAATGVDFISVGALTHSAAALDISLWLDER